MFKLWPFDYCMLLLFIRHHDVCHISFSSLWIMNPKSEENYLQKAKLVLNLLFWCRVYLQSAILEHDSLRTNRVGKIFVGILKIVSPFFFAFRSLKLFMLWKCLRNWSQNKSLSWSLKRYEGINSGIWLIFQRSSLWDSLVIISSLLLNCVVAKRWSFYKWKSLRSTPEALTYIATSGRKGKRRNSKI